MHQCPLRCFLKKRYSGLHCRQTSQAGTVFRPLALLLCLVVNFLPGFSRIGGTGKPAIQMPASQRITDPYFWLLMSAPRFLV